jgi:hypothetical protein
MIDFLKRGGDAIRFAVTVWRLRADVNALAARVDKLEQGRVPTLPTDGLRLLRGIWWKQGEIEPEGYCAGCASNGRRVPLQREDRDSHGAHMSRIGYRCPSCGWYCAFPIDEDRKIHKLITW